MTDSMPETYWTRLGYLWNVATGGPEVAARPDADFSSLPEADTPPGISEATEWFLRTSDNPDQRKFLFLVGGPGAGKSHATRKIVRELEPTEHLTDELAHRRYDYKGPHSIVTLINDATIPSQKYSQAPLLQEVDESIRMDTDLVVCVNRGILVEELIESNQVTPTVGTKILEWVKDGPTEDQNDKYVETTAHADYLRQGCIPLADGKKIQIIAVFADVCSLLEARPNITGLGTDGVVLEPYSIRTEGTPDSAPGHVSIAGSLLNKVLAYIGMPEKNRDWDPIAANLHLLSDPRIQKSWVNTLRASEVASGFKYTFRELWGAIARTIVGELPHRIERTELEQYVETLNPYTNDTDAAQPEDIIRIADLRWTQNIYGAGGRASTDRSLFDSDPVLRLTHIVDPMKDALPGAPWASKFGWFDPVAEAVLGATEGLNPFETITELANESGVTADPIIASKFDDGVIREFQRILSSRDLDEQKKSYCRNWYAAYLGRAFASSHNVTGFREATDIWINACELSPTIPTQLKHGLDVLLRPKSDPSSRRATTLIPLFESRTIPIVGKGPTSRLARLLPGFKMKTERVGEVLELILIEDETEKARMIIDFALIREALAAAEDFAGLTEMSEQTSPRLERFRSAQLQPQSMRDADIHIVGNQLSDDIQVKFSVGGLEI